MPLGTRHSRETPPIASADRPASPWLSLLAPSGQRAQAASGPGKVCADSLTSSSGWSSVRARDSSFPAGPMHPSWLPRDRRGARRYVLWDVRWHRRDAADVQNRGIARPQKRRRCDAPEARAPLGSVVRAILGQPSTPERKWPSYCG